MADNSDNSELLIEKEESIPENPEKEKTIPIDQEAAPMSAKQEAKEEIVQGKPAPKSRGRPAGSKDNKPRIKRVPVQPPPQQQQETAANEATPTPPKKPRNMVEIRYEEEPQQEEPVEEEEQLPPPPKSPRTMQRERVQQAATQRRQMAQARQDHFERILDNFMGF